MNDSILDIRSSLKKIHGYDTDGCFLCCCERILGDSEVVQHSPLTSSPDLVIFDEKDMRSHFPLFHLEVEPETESFVREQRHTSTDLLKETDTLCFSSENVVSECILSADMEDIVKMIRNVPNRNKSQLLKEMEELYMISSDNSEFKTKLPGVVEKYADVINLNQSHGFDMSLDDGWFDGSDEDAIGVCDDPAVHYEVAVRQFIGAQWAN